ncbi:hypothetical protein ABE021_01285 [Sporosarcina gallistercoris]|uniref:hypothetical protein n=1 Tax=Sporosarcina gallistercoris TaxID=2762245 RepID=UPI003D289391
MSFQSEISPILSRKIISASISGTTFAIVLGLFIPDPFDVGIRSLGEYIRELQISVPGYLIYSFPVILLYGTIASMISDYIACFISNHTHKSLEIYFSFALHVLFGLVLLWYSLLASILYFITDYILIKKNIYKWSNALLSLGIPLVVLILFFGSIHIVDMFG